MIRIAISPCPNDVFLYYGLLTKKVSFKDPYEFTIKPLHELNKAYDEGTYDFIKVSSVPYLRSPENYRVCPKGGAFSSSKGQLLLAKKKYSDEELKNVTFVVAGKNTTAALLIQSLFDSPKMIERPFYQVVEALQKDEAQVGAVVHEARTLSSKYGLVELFDLPQKWFKTHGVSTPLAVLAAKRSLPDETYQSFLEAIENSFQCALENKQEALKLCAEYGQEKDLDALWAHIENFLLSQKEISEEIQTEALEFLAPFAKDTYHNHINSRFHLNA